MRYLFLGSKTHVVKRMFGDRTRPFYNSAAVMKLDVPPDSESREFISSRFASRGLSAESGAVDAVMEASRGIPYYVQAVSAVAFESVSAEGRTEVRPEDVRSAVETIVKSKSDLWETAVQSLSPAQRTLLSALAKKTAKRFGGRYRSENGLGASSGVHSALGVLLAKGFVESTPEGYAVGDPLFARYLSEPAWRLF